MAQLPLDLRLGDDYSFDNYLIGENKLLVAAALDADDSAPIYLWGKPGSGKTHFLHALLKSYIDSNQSVALLSADNIDELDPSFCQGLEQCRLVCIDDIDEVSITDEWQNAVFHLFNRLKDNSVKLVCSADRVPQQLDVLADLQSRLASCLIFEQRELSDDEKMTALQSRAKTRGFELSDDVVSFLMSRVQRDIHSLFGLLDQLDKHSLAKQRRLTVPFVREVLFS